MMACNSGNNSNTTVTDRVELPGTVDNEAFANNVESISVMNLQMGDDWSLVQFPELAAGDNYFYVLEYSPATERVRVRNRYVSVSWAYHDLEQKLTYKALEHGQKVIKVDPKYTSQRCPVCGHTERGNRNKDKHMFCCRHCGYTSNDDRIGAMNIYRKGIEYLGSRIPV